MPISPEAQAALITAVNDHVTALITELSGGTLNAIFEIINETKFGLMHRSDHAWQNTSSIDPGISQFIFPPQKNDTGEEINEEANNAIIPFQNTGTNGVFVIVAYDVCKIPPGQRKNYTKWVRQDTVIVFGCLLYSTAIENSKFLVKGYPTKAWEIKTWENVLQILDKPDNGYYTSSVTIGSGITAWGQKPFSKDVLKERGGTERTKVYKIILQD